MAPGPLEPSSKHEKEIDTREHLSKLQGLFILTQLIAESMDEDNMLRLAGSSVPSLGPVRLVGIHLRDTSWYEPLGEAPPLEARAEIEAQLAGVTASRGPVASSGGSQAWAYTMRSPNALVGHLVVAADSELTPWTHFLLGTLAQQTGIALTTARLYTSERAQAIELQKANSALGTTVKELERSTAIHKRLTQVAVAGEGEQGIAEALHELTSWPVAIEDRFGNLRAWAGPGRPDPYPKQTQPTREALMRRAQAAGGPFHDADRLLAIARPRQDVLGVIVLIGVPPEDAERAQTALEHGSTVLAMELARLQTAAETELRLGRDLVEELLGSANEWTTLNRANALGYDLLERHRVAVVVEEKSSPRDPDARFHAVRRAARDAGLGSLLVPRGDAVVVLAHNEQVWDTFYSRLRNELGTDVFVGVGGPCDQLSDFPRSYREATLALRMRTNYARLRRTLFYEQLGTYRLLAEVGELKVIDRFVEEWIGSLIDYDSRHRANLVDTLHTYLECGGNYDATTAALFVHRNTLKYRLRRIREISKLDLKNPDTKFNLQLASRAWSTRKALERTAELQTGADSPTG